MSARALNRRRTVLCFAGSDSAGGAGLQADITTCTLLGVHPFSVATVLTAQDNQHVHGIFPVSPEFVEHQARAVIDAFAVDAVKIGVIGGMEHASALIRVLDDLRLRNPSLTVVLDPVLSSTAGDALASSHAAEVLRAVVMLLPWVTVITPNTPEALRLTGETDTALQACALLEAGSAHVLLKGGHGRAAEPEDVVTNLAFPEGVVWHWPRLVGEFHGSGCTLSTAIAAYLALGLPVSEALSAAQNYCYLALQQGYALADATGLQAAVGQRFPYRLADLFLHSHFAGEA